MSLTTILESYPEGRVFLKPSVEAAEELFLCNALSRDESLDPLFAELAACGLSQRLHHLDIECDWADEVYETNFTEALDLLERHGPFEQLRKISVFAADYMKPARIERLEVIETAAPNLRSIDISVPYGVGLGRPFRLDTLESALLDDVHFVELDIVTRCSFPNLTHLHVTIDIDSIEDDELALSALRRLFGGDGFAPQLTGLFVTIFYRERVNERFTSLLAQSYADLLQRPALQRVMLPELFEDPEHETFRDTLGDKLVDRP